MSMRSDVLRSGQLPACPCPFGLNPATAIWQRAVSSRALPLSMTDPWARTGSMASCRTLRACSGTPNISCRQKTETIRNGTQSKDICQGQWCIHMLLGWSHLSSWKVISWLMCPWALSIYFGTTLRFYCSKHLKINLIAVLMWIFTYRNYFLLIMKCSTYAHSCHVIVSEK